MIPQMNYKQTNAVNANTRSCAETALVTAWLHAVECGYNAVQYNTAMHSTLQ